MFGKNGKDLYLFCTTRPDLQAGKILHFLFSAFFSFLVCLTAFFAAVPTSVFAGQPQTSCTIYQPADAEVLPDLCENPAASCDSACLRTQNRRQTRTAWTDQAAPFCQTAALFTAVRLPVKHFQQHFCCTALQHINSIFSRDGPLASLIFNA